MTVESRLGVLERKILEVERLCAGFGQIIAMQKRDQKQILKLEQDIRYFKHGIQMNADRIRLMKGKYVRSVNTLIRENRNKVGVKYDEFD